ncbi:ribosomal protein L7/L12 [Nocardiopsis sp. HUAS JQ3]|uniref:ribosomal protein L7/L12 n=1 Tax=Nocardiopsis sp. HUAS JQ3 TaxID=3061629 RepID=UPI0023A9E120|nr:ribosomal protein L7/L12 [Nocardiopsis sp. HUAS JQ3]WDZ93407.1 ribosomal protein L7/L12 [Nocardiopsis sp. HUAS JQ3]
MAGFFERLLGPEPMRRPIGQGTVDEAQALVRADRKIEAIKLVRERTGAGLAEAKHVVDAVEQGHWIPVEPAPGQSLADRARELLAQDRAADAVTTVSRETGMTEAEATRFVDALDR